MNPIDTLRLVLDHQAAMRHEVHLNALTRTARARQRTRAFAPDEVRGLIRSRRDTIANPCSFD